MTVDIVLLDPKWPHNVGAAVRAASCWEARQVLFTGNRVMKVVAEDGRPPTPHLDLYSFVNVTVGW